MSKYRRDDKAFRAQITKLADAGLVLGSFKKEVYPAHIGQACSLYRARPCSECEQPAGFNGAPAYVRTIAPPAKRGHFNLPGLIIGLIYGAIVGGAVVGIVALIVGGVR